LPLLLVSPPTKVGWKSSAVVPVVPLLSVKSPLLIGKVSGLVSPYV